MIWLIIAKSLYEEEVSKMLKLIDMDIISIISNLKINHSIDYGHALLSKQIIRLYV